MDRHLDYVTSPFLTKLRWNFKWKMEEMAVTWQRCGRTSLMAIIITFYSGLVNGARNLHISRLVNISAIDPVHFSS